MGRLVAGRLAAVSTPLPGSTFEDVAKAWVSGALAKRYPDHVKVKRSVDDDRYRLNLYVLPLLRGVPMSLFRLDHAEEVMATLPSALSPGSRRQVAQVIHRIAALVVYPLRLATSNPIPRGWLPKVRREDQRPQEVAYPDEVDRFIACASPKIDIGLRLFAGFIAREGMRHDEAERLTWGDVVRGMIRLDENRPTTHAPG